MARPLSALPSSPSSPSLPFFRSSPAVVPAATQADTISRIDEELRKEMVDVQAQVARWVTEQKHCADTVALKGARMLETDKGAGCQLDFVSCSGFLRSFTCRRLGFPSQKTWSSCT